jgi:hypothetical protein
MPGSGILKGSLDSSRSTFCSYEFKAESAAGVAEDVDRNQQLGHLRSPPRHGKAAVVEVSDKSLRLWEYVAGDLMISTKSPKPILEFSHKPKFFSAFFPPLSA